MLWAYMCVYEKAQRRCTESLPLMERMQVRRIFSFESEDIQRKNWMLIFILLCFVLFYKKQGF